MPFDEIVTASDAGSYKPALGHWRVFFERTRAARDQRPRGPKCLSRHCAGERAGPDDRLDQPAGERADSAPTRELPDLENLPDTLDALVGQ